MDSTTILSPELESPELDDADAPQVLLVRVGDDRWALHLADVRGVTRGGRLARLPGAPTWVRGLAPARGTLVPVADLPRRAGSATAALPAWRVLVEIGDRSAYLAVDDVDGVHPIGKVDDAVLPAGSTLPAHGAVRLPSQSGAGLGDATTATVLDVVAVFRELFEED